MLNTPVTPPRVPIIDPRTGQIDRAWYMFFLSLFQSSLTPNVPPDVGPTSAGVVDQVSELAKAFQSILVGPENAGVLEQINEFIKQLKAFQIGPTNNALLEQIATLRNEVQAFYLLPSNQPSATGVTSVDGSGGTTGLTLTGGPITSAGTLTLGGTLAVANGGTGTATPSLVAGTNITISGTWPNQTVNSSSSGVTSFSAGSTGLTPATATTGAITLAGTLAIANGGIGATSFASADLPTLSGSNTFSGVMTTTGQSNQFTALTYATTDGVGGVHAYLGENTSYAVVGGVNGVVLASGGTYPGTGRVVVDAFGTNNSLRPFSDNVTSLGTSGQRWTEVYAVNGTINTSDATEKQQIRELNDAERRTAQRIKGLIRAFKWTEAVESKGDGARIHIGVIAQDVEAAFTAEGLDASKYGLFCRDTWDTLDGPPQTRLGVRYEELLAFVIGSL